MKHGLERLAKSTLIYGVGEALSRFISFLLLPVFTSYLTPMDYGISSILGVLSLLITPVFSLGLGAATGVCYFEGNNRARKDTTIWTAFIVLAVSTSILAVLGTVFSRDISRLAFATREYHYLVAISLLSSCLGILTVPFRLYLQFEERAITFAALTMISTLASIGLSIIMVVFLGKGIQGLIEAGLMGQAITFTLFLLAIAPKTKCRFSWPLGNELLQLGLPLIPSFAFLFVIHHGNKYILQWFEGLDAVGVYTVGFNCGFVLNLAVSGFSNAWMPYFMSCVDKKDEARVLFGRILTYYVFAFGTLSLLFSIAAKPVVMIMTQPAFHTAYKVVGLTAGAQAITGVYSILLPGIYFAKEVRYVGLTQGVAMLGAISLNVLLIPSFGLLGAAVALVAGVLTLSILQQVWNRKRGYLDVQYEWSRILWFAVIWGVCTVLALWEREFSVLGEVSVSAAAAAALVPILLFGLLNSSERRALGAMARQLSPKLRSIAYFKV